MVYPIFGRTILPLFRSFVAEIRGLDKLPKHGGFILAANHIGFIDYFFVASVIVSHLDQKVYFISRPEKWWNYLGKGISSWLGRIEVNPDNKAGCLDEAINILKNQGVVFIYPEGVASKGKELNEGKTGVARLALGSGLPVVPLGIYAPIAYPGFWRSIKSLKDNFKKVKLYFGQPQYFTKPSEITKPILEEVTKKVMKEIAKLSGKHYPY